MRSGMSAKFSHSSLFLLASFLMLFDPLVSEAQNNSAVNLAGTEWTTGEVIIPTANIDNSITTLTRYLVFYKQGKVEAAIVRSKSAGGKTELVREYVGENVYNAATGRYEYQTVPKQVQKYVMTPPEFYPEAWKGTYEIRGKSVYLDFPACTIEASISNNTLKGVVTYKGSKEKEAWVLSPLTSKQNKSGGGTSNSGALRENRSFGLTGNWKGTYFCGQGLTNLNLSITQISASELTAIFNFAAHSSNPSVPSGSFRMTGTYNSLTNKIILKATEWINQPLGYTSVDLVGSISQGNTKMSGEIVNSNCSTFTLEKR